MHTPFLIRFGCYSSFIINESAGKTKYDERAEKWKMPIYKIAHCKFTWVLLELAGTIDYDVEIKT